MTTWVTITDPNTATGAIITQALMRAYRDNMRSLAEDDASVPALDTIKRLGRQNHVVVGTGVDTGAASLQVYGGSRADFIKAGTIDPNVADNTGSRLNVCDTNGVSTAVRGNILVRIASFAANADCTIQFTDATTYNAYVGMTGGVLRLGAGVSGNDATLNSSGAFDAISFGTTGTFTPSLIGTGGGSAHTYTFRQGRYWKVGKTVHFTIRVSLSAKDGTMTGAISISGLPFAVITTDAFGAVIPYLDGYTFAGFSSIGGYLGASSTAINLWKMGSGTTVALQPADVGAASNLFLSGSYTTP